MEIVKGVDEDKRRRGGYMKSNDNAQKYLSENPLSDLLSDTEAILEAGIFKTFNRHSKALSRCLFDRIVVKK